MNAQPIYLGLQKNTISVIGMTTTIDLFSMFSKVKYLENNIVGRLFIPGNQTGELDLLKNTLKLLITSII